MDPQATRPTPTTAPALDPERPLWALFERLADRGSIRRPSAVAYLDAMGLGRGRLGHWKVKASVEIMMALFDRSPRDGGVTWKKLSRYGMQIVPSGLRVDGRLDGAVIRREFERVAAGKSVVGRADVESYVDSLLPKLLRPHLTAVASALAFDALDTTRDGELTWRHVERAIDEFNRAHGDELGRSER